MHIIKLAIISFVFFFLLITGISLFIPSHISISKAIDIRTEKDSLMVQLSNAVNWKKWYPGADTSDFFIADGKILGILSGDLKGLIITETTDSSVSTANAGPNSKKGESGWNIFAGTAPDIFTVQWHMDFHFRWYPWEKFSGLLLEKRYGPVMEKGLSNLKALLEK